MFPGKEEAHRTAFFRVSISEEGETKAQRLQAKWPLTTPMTTRKRQQVHLPQVTADRCSNVAVLQFDSHFNGSRSVIEPNRTRKVLKNMQWINRLGSLIDAISKFWGSIIEVLGKKSNTKIE